MARAQGADGEPDCGVVLTNEFASVRLSVDRRGHTPRLLVEDLDGSASILLEPLELASFCHVGDEERVAWLRVGDYQEPPE
jgi:hypothetical protein